MSEPALAARMAVVAEAVEGELDRLLTGTTPSIAHLLEAMRYATLGGGKRVRAFLVDAFGNLFGAEPAATRRTGAAIELIHAYSLVHDDLPAMDDADLRRGKPALHRAHGEAIAILAGDALQAFAFEVLARDDWPASPPLRAELVARLAAAAGPEGMCGGQYLDLAASGRDLDAQAIRELQARKTGALITFAGEAGCIIAAAGAAARRTTREYCDALGLAFQITDDLLDIEASSAELGKSAGRDVAQGKATFVGLLGVEGARAELGRLEEVAVAALDSLPGHTHHLRELFAFVTSRRA